MATGECYDVSMNSRACLGCGGNVRRDSKTGYCLTNPSCLSLARRVRRKNSPPGDPVRRILDSAKFRAKALGLPFDITPEDYRAVQVTNCPVFGFELKRNSGKLGHTPASPSLDRIEPIKGYVRGNIQMLSQKANAMKQDATREELLQFARWILATYGEGSPDSDG